MINQSLTLLQHWMKTVLTERGTLSQKLQTALQQHGLRIEDVVAEKRGLSSLIRIGIYARGYMLRLLGCMQADFPALRNFLGDSVFDAFAMAFIISKPPTSPSLFDLGAGFPQFLEETKPREIALDAELTALLDLPPELARLERARVEVMRAPGTEQDPVEAESFSPFAIFSEKVTLQSTPCLRLLELKFPLVDILRKSDQGEKIEPPEPRVSFVALGRSNYRVHMDETAPWQFAFLKACEHPVPFYQAMQSAARESGNEPAFLLAQLVTWLPIATGFGFLRMVNTPLS
jgi:Putative DNA-binding domain